MATHNLNTIKINGYLAHTNFDWFAAGFTSVTNFWDRGLYSGKSFGPLDANETGGPGSWVWQNGVMAISLTVRGSYVLNIPRAPSMVAVLITVILRYTQPTF